MHVLIEGVEGAQDQALVMFRTADRVLTIKILADDGQLINMTTDTASLLYIYDTEDRRNAPLLTITLAATSLTGGVLSATITDTQMATLDAGGTYWAAVRRDSGSTTYTWSPKMTKIKIA
jgi:hypothetical protein